MHTHGELERVDLKIVDLCPLLMKGIQTIQIDIYWNVFWARASGDLEPKLHELSSKSSTGIVIAIITVIYVPHTVV